jgi:uncharacterized RDD family membrane protein YckC
MMVPQVSFQSAPLPSAALHTPSLRRRLACFVYEGALLFGVVIIAGYLFSTLSQQRHALMGRHGLQAFVFVILAIYFVWFWSRGGQTLAMKTWHMRLLTSGGQPVGQVRALMRYLLCWVWFVPSLALIWLMGWSGSSLVFGSMLAWIVIYAALSLLRADRQYWHDAICGTRIVSSSEWPGPAKAV